MKRLRIGHGFDVHPLVAGRKLTIGGVTIPFDKGLAGHSDGDVLLHAIIDALLGAAGLPDIGQQFPPTDEKYRNIDSRLLLQKSGDLIRSAGYDEIINIDTTIMAEMPKMNPHREEMRKIIAEDLGIGAAQVNLKATTTERLGFTGRGEGIAASAVCLIAGS
jgi:2-C-methyl-D-erythritol 2,4-cyclodiphosphate synthase